MTWSTRAFADIAALVTGRTGLSFPPARRAFAEAGIWRAMSRARARDAAIYLELLGTDLQTFEILLSEITVGETYFYRDPRQTEFIRSAVLSSLSSPMRIWSAGCATGEEAYTLAIMLEECGLESSTQIFATDISPAAISTARAGVYGDWSFREIDSTWRARYFARSGKNKWKVAERFRPRIAFEARNLSDSASLEGAFDVVLCRNVLMYLETDVSDRVMSMLTAALREGGWLFTSPSDPIVREGNGIEIVTTPAGLAYRRFASRVLGVGFEVNDPPLVERSRHPAEPVLSVAERSRRVPLQTPSRETSSRLAAAKAAPPPISAVVVPIIDETLDPERYVREAMELLDAHRAGEAAVAARRAIFLDREGAFAHLLLGRALRLGGRTLAARRALGRARRLSEDGDGVAASVDAELFLLRGGSSSVEVGV